MNIILAYVYKAMYFFLSKPSISLVRTELNGPSHSFHVSSSVFCGLLFILAMYGAEVVNRKEGVSIKQTHELQCVLQDHNTKPAFEVLDPLCVGQLWVMLQEIYSKQEKVCLCLCVHVSDALIKGCRL